MSKTSYELPEKAKEVIEELAEQVLNRSLYYHYMSFLLRHGGFRYASDAFYQRSKDETWSYDDLNNFLAMRGVTVEAPKPEMPKVKFVDLRTAVQDCLALEIDTIDMLNEVILEMLTVDHMAYLELSSKMSSQRYRVETLQAMWVVFEKLESFEDQLEQERSYYCPSVEGEIAKC